MRSKFQPVLSVLCVLATAAVASAQPSLWTNYNGVAPITWTTATNWNPVGAPVSGVNTSLIFSSVPQVLPPIANGFQQNGNYSTTNDNAALFTLNSIRFDASTQPDAALSAVLLASSNAAGGIVFAGSNPTIIQNGTSTVNFSNGASTNDQQLTSSGLTVQGAGLGHIRFQGTFTGNGNLNFNMTGVTPMFSGPQIFLTPTVNANTFNGNVTLTSGNLTLDAAIPNGPLGPISNTLIIGGGSLRATTAAPTFDNPVQLNATLNIVGTLGMTIRGPVTGNADIALRSSANVATIFQNTVDTNGAVIVEGQSIGAPNLTLSSVAGAQNGTMLNAGSYTARFANIVINNTVTTVPRLNPAASLNLSSGFLTVLGGAGGPTAEAVAFTTVEGNSAITLTPAATQPLSFNGGLMTLSNRGTLNVTTQGAFTLGGAPGTAGNANLFFNNLDATSNINGILPTVAGFVTVAGVNRGTYTRYNNTTGVTPLDLTLDYALSTNRGLPSLTFADNFRLVSTKNTIEGANGLINANSLLLETPSAAGSLGGGIFGTGNINLFSGGINTVLVGGTVIPTFQGMTIQPNIVSFAPTTGLVFHIQTPTLILGNILNPSLSGLTRSGAGQLTLLGNNVNLQGGLTVNGGTTAYSSDENLGAPGQPLTFSIGSTTGGSILFQPNSTYTTASVGTHIGNRPVTIAGSVGGLGPFIPNNQVIWNGIVSGSGRFTKFGGGTLTLTAANEYTGDTVIFQGTLAVSSDASLGSPASNINFGANANVTLQANASFATARNMLFTSGTANTGTLFTNGPSTVLTVLGNLGGSVTGASLTKVGEGELVLRADNSINGPVAIGEAVATRRQGASFAQHGGTLTLAGSGGLSTAILYTLNNGSTLKLDNTLGVHQNRLSSSNILMNGAELVVVGNSSTTMFEHVGRTAIAGISSSALGNIVTLDQPPASPPGINLNLISTGYNVVGPAMMLFRGTNLGVVGPGDFTRLTFATAPPITNGLINGALYANSPTAAPQDFAAYTAGSGIDSITRFNGYVVLPTTGGAATTTHSLIGTQQQGGGVTSNALKLTGATLDLNNNALTLSGGAGMILSVGNDSIVTTVGAPAVVFGTLPARISVNGSLAIGSAAQPVNVTGSAGLHKFGPGNLHLSASGITGGGYVVSHGTLTLLAQGGFTGGQTVTIRPGATFNINGNGTVASPVGIMALAGFGDVNIGTGAISTGAVSVAFGGSFHGTGTLIHGGTLIQTLNGNSPAFSGDVRLLVGTVVVDANVVPNSAVGPGPFGTGTSPIQLGNTSGTTTATLTLGANVTRFDRDIFVPSGIPNTTAITLGTTGNVVTSIGSNFTLGRQLRLNGAFSDTLHVPGATTLLGNITDDGVGGVGRIDLLGGNYNFHGANNTFSGGIFVEASVHNVIGLGSDTALGSGPIVIARAQTFTGSFRADFGPRTIANQFDYGGDVAAPISNTVGFVGTNNLTFTSPTVNLDNGVVRTWEVVNTGRTTFTGNITGTSSLVKTGGGRLALAGQSTFSGGFTLAGGSLSFRSSTQGTPIVSGPIGTGTFTISGSTFSAENGPQNIENPTTWASDVTVEGMNDITMGGAINIGSATRRIIVNNSAATNLSNTITGSGGIIAENNGGNNLTFSGNSTGTWTGGLTIEEGAVRINNTAGSGTGDGPVGVLAGGKLEGNGFISGNVNTGSGGRVGGGNTNSPATGTLTLDGPASTFAVASGGVVSLGITDGSTPAPFSTGGSTLGGLINPTSNSFILKTGAGASTIDPGALIEVDATGTAFNFFSQYSYTIADLTGDFSGLNISLAGQFTFTGVATDGPLSLTGAADGRIFLNFTPIPEPAFGLALAAMGLLAIRRRR